MFDTCESMKTKEYDVYRHLLTPARLRESIIILLKLRRRFPSVIVYPEQLLVSQQCKITSVTLFNIHSPYLSMKTYEYNGLTNTNQYIYYPITTLEQIIEIQESGDFVSVMVSKKLSENLTQGSIVSISELQPRFGGQQVLHVLLSDEAEAYSLVNDYTSDIEKLGISNHFPNFRG